MKPHLLAVFASVVAANDLAATPDSIAGFVYHSIGTTVVNNYLGFGYIFHSNGTYTNIYCRAATDPRFSRLDPNQFFLRPPIDGTYTYWKLDERVAVITMKNGTAGSTPNNVTLSFRTDTEGVAGNGATVGTEFVLAPPAVQPLLNCSNRSYVRAGKTASTGFFISGNLARSVLVRAIGPGLASFGISDFLRDPSLLVVSAQGAFAGANDDWGKDNTAAIVRLNSLAGAFPLIVGSKDAVVFLRLTAGAYVAEIKSADASDAGEVLIEVYMLP